jgi:bifunctional UDP-N-acetylglucosamine pyrophosphorylase/glucosamine-1-phosphate N-acetyltransferase
MLLVNWNSVLSLSMSVLIVSGFFYIVFLVTKRWKHIHRLFMIPGVIIIDMNSTYIEADTKIGKGTVIWPNTHIQGNSKIGNDCVVGPNSIIRDSIIGNQCKVFVSVVDNTWMEDDVTVGPFSHLSKGAHLEKEAHVGNFGEVKDSTLGPGVKMRHFSYIGNTTIGANTNIGAGTVTCNYDGVRKHLTEIGANVFIGSDSMLVAPLKIGDRSRTGAGSVVTKDIPDDTLVVGMPARTIRKLGKRDTN